MSILKTTLVIPPDKQETINDEIERKRLMICINFAGDGLSPAQVVDLIKRLENYLASIESRKRKIEEMKRKYQNAE